MANRPTLRDFRSQLAGLAATVGSPLGQCINNIPALAGLVNIATEELLSDPQAPDEGWWGGWARYVFTVNQSLPFIIAPREVARLILMDVCQRPRKIQNGFFEFLDFGEGLKPDVWRRSVCNDRTTGYDRETVAILGTFSGTPQQIRIFPVDARDVGKSVIVQGTDQNGNTILGTDPITNQPISGEIVTLALPFSQTLNTFIAAPTGILKDATFGPITIQQVDPVSGLAQPLSSMQPSETAANYRRYFVDRLPCNCCASPPGPIQITAMARLEYIPIASDPDYLGLPNVPALIAQCESLRFRNMDNVKALGMAEKKHSDALHLLFGQLDKYLGNERPALNLSLFGRRGLQKQPL